MVALLLDYKFRHTYHIDVVCQFHLPWDVVLPDGLAEDVVRLLELYGNHDATMHGLVKIIRPVGGHYDEAIMSVRGEG